MTQKEKVLEQLQGAGERGVNSFWGYVNFIPRMGAIIHILRKEGYAISSTPQKNHSTQYILTEEPTI